MVHELHKRGYQLLRFAPGMSPSGAHWRCAITPKSNIRSDHGAMLLHDDDRLAARYTSGQGNEYFGWLDATSDTACELATKFEEQHSDLLRECLGRDWEYVGWYVEMLGIAEQGTFPIAYADYPLPEDRLETIGEGSQTVIVPLPPL